MASKVTSCSKCGSYDIQELNPTTRDTSTNNLCTISCKCNGCAHLFTIKSWTKSGKRKGIRY